MPVGQTVSRLPTVACGGTWPVHRARAVPAAVQGGVALPRATGRTDYLVTAPADATAPLRPRSPT
ncbi:hypothetical protein [Actinacidiphila acidipaludis]|uniref:Uncharacterized protein n=1 Tax=Actinacidiphila acidipaludis TaxID=2873382 RepID=A0ABS7QJH7_9ACTN|nr:hypothetical protein [Streptomyces acidipaludis]MBY8882585.1 hypothetical protein [Streptomyces acidipaludis]